MIVEVLYQFVIEGVTVQGIAHKQLSSVKDVEVFLMRAGFSSTDCGKYSYLKDAFDIGNLKAYLSEYATLDPTLRSTMSFGEYIGNSTVDIGYTSPSKSVRKAGFTDNKALDSNSRHEAWNHIANSGGSSISSGKKRVNERALHFMHDDWNSMTETVKKKHGRASRTIKIVCVAVGVLLVVTAVILLVTRLT